MSRLNDPYLSKTSSGSSSSGVVASGANSSTVNNGLNNNNKRPIAGQHVSSAKKESLEELKKQKLSAYMNNPVVAARLSTQMVKNPFEETNQQLVGEVDKLRRELADRVGHIQALDGENFQLREYINKLEVESVNVKELYEQSLLDLERRQLELDDWREQFLNLNEKYNGLLAKQQLEVKRPAKSSMISMMQLEEVEEEESQNEQLSVLNFTLTGDEEPAEAMRVFVKINQLMDKYIQRMAMCRKLSNKISYIFSKHTRLSIGGNNDLGNNVSPYIIQPTQQQSQQFHQPTKSTKRRTTRRSSMLFLTNNDTGTLLETQQQHITTEQQSSVSPVRASNKSNGQSQRIETWPNSGASSNYSHLQHLRLGEIRRSANESNKSIRDEVMQEEEEMTEEEEEETNAAADKNISIESDEEEQDVVEDTQQDEDDEEEEEEDEVVEENMDQNGLDVILEATELENTYHRDQMDDERENMIEEEEEIDTEAVESQAETIEDDTEPETEIAADPIASRYLGPGSIHSMPPETGARSFLPNSTYVVDAGDPSPSITPSLGKTVEEKSRSRTRRSQQPVQIQNEKEDRVIPQPHHPQLNSSRNVRFEEDSDEGPSPVLFKKTPFKHRSTSSLATVRQDQEESTLNDSTENVKKLNIKPKPILRKSVSMTQLDEPKPIADTPAMSKSKSIFKQKENQSIAASPAPPPKPDTEEDANGKSRRGRRKTIEHNNKDYDSVSNYLEEIVEQAAVSDSTNYTHSTTNRSRGRGRPRSTARANPEIVEVPLEAVKQQPSIEITNNEVTTTKPGRKNSTIPPTEASNEIAKPQLPPLPPNGGRKQTQKRPFDSVGGENNGGIRSLPPPAPARPPLPIPSSNAAPAPPAPVSKNVLSSNTSAINLKANLSTPTNRNTSPKKMRFTPPDENDSSHTSYNPHDDSGRAGCNASLSTFNLMSAGLEGSARRARKPVSYKEIPLNCKVRRDEKNQVVYKNLEKKGIMNPDEDLAASSKYNKENALPH